MKRRKSDAASAGHAAVSAGPSSKRPRHEHSRDLEQAVKEVGVSHTALKFVAAQGPQPLTQPDSSTAQQQPCSQADTATASDKPAGKACNPAADALAASTAGAVRPEGVPGPITPDIPLTLPLGLAQLAMRAPAAAAAAATAAAAAAAQHHVRPQHTHDVRAAAQDVQHVQDAHHKSAGQGTAAGQLQHAQQKAPFSSSKPLCAKARRATLLMLDQNAPAGLPADSTPAATAAVDSGAQRQQEQQDPTAGHHSRTGRKAAHSAGGSGGNSLAARRKAQLLMLPPDTAQVAAPVTGQQHAGPSAQQQLDPSECRTAGPGLPSLTAPVAAQQPRCDPQEEQQQHADAGTVPCCAVGAPLPAPSRSGPYPAAAQPQLQLQQDADVRQPDAASDPALARQQQQHQVHADSTAPVSTAAQQRATASDTSSDISRQDGRLQHQTVRLGLERSQPSSDLVSAGLPSDETAVSVDAMEDMPILFWARKQRHKAAAAAASQLLGLKGCNGVQLLPQAALAAPAHPRPAAAAAAGAEGCQQPQEQQCAHGSSAAAPHPQLARCGRAEQPSPQQQLPQEQSAAAPTAECQQQSQGADQQQQEKNEAAAVSSPAPAPLTDQDFHQQQRQQRPAADSPAVCAAECDAASGEQQQQQRVSVQSARRAVSASVRRRAVLLGVQPGEVADSEAWLQQLLSVAEQQQAAGSLGAVSQQQPQQPGLAQLKSPVSSRSNTPCGPRSRRLAQLLPPLEPAAAPPAAAAADNCAAEDAARLAAAQAQIGQQQQQLQLLSALQDADAGSAGPLLLEAAQPGQNTAAPGAVTCLVQDPAARQPTQEQPPPPQQQQQHCTPGSAVLPMLVPEQLEPQQQHQQHVGAISGALCAEPGCGSPMPVQQGQELQQQQQQEDELIRDDGDPTPASHMPTGVTNSPLAGPGSQQAQQQQQQQHLSGVQSARKPVGVSARRRAALLGVAPEVAAEGQPWVEQLLSAAAAEGSLVLRKPSPANKLTSVSSSSGSGGPKGAKARRLAQLLQLPAVECPPPLPAPAPASTEGAAAAGTSSCQHAPLPQQQVEEQLSAENASCTASLVVATQELPGSPAAPAAAANTLAAFTQPDASAAVSGLSKPLALDCSAGMPGTMQPAPTSPAAAGEAQAAALASPAVLGSNALPALAALTSPAAAVAGGDTPSEGLLSPESFTHGQDTVSDMAALVCSLLPQASNSSSYDDSSNSGGCAGAEQGAEADSGGGYACSRPSGAAAAAAAAAAAGTAAGAGDTGAAPLSAAAMKPAVGMELDGNEQQGGQCESPPASTAAAAAAASAAAAACRSDAADPVAMDVDTPPISSSLSAGGSSNSEEDGTSSDTTGGGSDSGADRDQAHRATGSCERGDATAEGADKGPDPVLWDVSAGERSAVAVCGDAAAGASVPAAAAATAAVEAVCPSDSSSSLNSTPAAPEAADTVSGATAVPATALQVSGQSPPQQHSPAAATAAGANAAAELDASPPFAAADMQVGQQQQQQQQLAPLPPLPPLPPMQAPQSTPVLTAQQRVCSRRQGSPSTPLLQFQLGLSPSARPAGVSRAGQQQQHVAQLLQLVGSFATANAGHTPGMDGPRSASAGCDTAAQLDQAAATPAAAAAAVGQEESPITPDTTLPLSAASRSQQRLSGLGLLQSGGSLVSTAAGGSSSVQRSRPRPMLGSIAQRRAALLMSPDTLAATTPAAAAAGNNSSSSQGQAGDTGSKGGDTLGAWLQFQAAAAVGACHEASGDVLRDQCHAPSISPEQQQRQSLQGAVPGSSTAMELEAALLLESGSHTVQQHKGSTPSRAAAGRSSPHALQQSPAVHAASSRRSPAVQHSPSSRHLLQSPGLKPRRSPPPLTAAAAAAGPADDSTAAADSSVPAASPAAPARYIPAAALTGVSRTMVYVRMPGARQARQAKANRQAPASSSRSRQTAAPFGSFPLAPGELPDGAGTCPVKETLEQALRAAHLDLQLAQAAVEGFPWATCDLAGVPLDASDAQLRACKDRYEEVKGRVMRCRHPNDVAKLDKQLAAEWEWLQDVRRSMTAAASQCSKQGILRRKSVDQEAQQGGWVVDNICGPAAAQQCSAQAEAATRPCRVTFCLPGSPETSV